MDSSRTLELMVRAQARLDAGTPIAVVTVIDTVGSAPRELGAKMLVDDDGVCEGTIGGGTLEALATRDAVLALCERRSRRSRYNLGATGPRSVGMFCGGEVEVFIEVLEPVRRVVIVGGGHVGLAIGQLAQWMRVPHEVIDDRAEFVTSERFPGAVRRISGPLPDSLSQVTLDRASRVCIATRCHVQDTDCLAAVMASPAEYIGMIGSTTKVQQVLRRLRARGIDPAADPRVHAPMGLALGSSVPEHIAVSIFAQMLMLQTGASGRPLDESLPAPMKRPAPPAALPQGSPSTACAVTSIPSVPSPRRRARNSPARSR